MDKIKIKKLRNKAILSIVIIIGIIGGLRTYDDLNRNDEIIKEKFSHLQEEVLYEYNKELEKIKTIININGNILSKSKNFVEVFKEKQREKLYSLSKPLYNELTKNFSNKVIIHFHEKNHISFLRVHDKNRYGDNLKDTRPMVSQAIKTKTFQIAYEHGTSDKDQVTYRGVFPIFDKGNFLGVVEIGIDTSYINKSLELLVKKLFDIDSFFITLIKNDVSNFKTYSKLDGKISNYSYKTSEDIEEVLGSCQNSIENQTIEVSNKIYSLGLTQIALLNFKDEIIGYYFNVLDITKDIEKNNLFFYSSLAKPIIATLLIVFLIWWIFLMFYKNFLVLENHTRNILNSQKAMIVLTDGKNLIDCNESLLEFYGFDDIKKFTEKYECICNTFEKQEGYLQKEKDGITWIDKMIKEPESVFKVVIKDKNEELNIFSIILNSHYHVYNKNSEYYVITLTNISDLERANAQLIEQSKQASLGEMIGNIAHQWRQPLSAITTVASGVKLKNEYSQLDLQVLDKEMDIIVGRAQFLSDTIETFRNFIKEKKEKKKVILQERIDVALNIIEASLIDNHIEFKKVIEKEPIHISLVVGELTQVIINIINNAKDAIVENKVESGSVEISLYKEQNDVVISIEDNAGGIPENIMQKIFEPYFTTKHQSQGTGLGLYMSYKIVVESLNGKLYVENSKLGAKFYIKLPLDK